MSAGISFISQFITYPGVQNSPTNPLSNNGITVKNLSHTLCIDNGKIFLR